MVELIMPFAAVGLEDRPLVGGKGASLGALTRAGLPVPEGVVLTAAAFEAFLASLPAAADPRRRAAAIAEGDVESARRLAAEAPALFAEAPWPETVQEALRGALRILDPEGGTPLAVRSSATAEDGEATSFAGLQETTLWVRGEVAVERAIRSAWASLYSAESILYRRHHGLAEQEQAIAVVLQRMVDAEVSGVMFTISPTSGDPSVVVIEASFGLGSAIVGGEVTPDRYVLSKVTGDVIERCIATKARWHRPAPQGGVCDEEVPASRREQPALEARRLAELLTLARRVEDLYGAPQDVEWAYGPAPGEAASRLYLLQSRPETTHAKRQRSTPLARPQARPFDHVFAVLGKRGTN